MESLFQDVSEREMRIQKDLHKFLEEREELKVAFLKILHFLVKSGFWSVLGPLQTKCGFSGLQIFA